MNDTPMKDESEVPNDEHQVNNLYTNFLNLDNKSDNLKNHNASN